MLSLAPPDYLIQAKAYWRYVPGGGGKVDTAELIHSSDQEFLAVWDEQKRTKRLTYWEDAEFARYFALRVRNRDVLSFGCGLAYTELDLLEAGARVTFADIVPSNVDCVERLCALRGYSARSRFLWMEDSASADYGGPYDFVFADGVLMHMPRERQREVLDRMFASLGPGGVVWLMLYTPRFVESVGVDLNPVDFGRASDPSVGEFHNPWSEWHNDATLLELAGPEISILNKEEFNEGRYAWYALGRRSEHRATSVRPFVDLPSVEAKRVRAEIREALLIHEAPLHRTTVWEAAVSLRPETGLTVTTTPNNFRYAVAFPKLTIEEIGGVPDRLVLDATVERGGFSVALLDVETNQFFYMCTIWRNGAVSCSRNLSSVRWPKQFQIVVSNYQPGAPDWSEWRLRRLALYKSCDRLTPGGGIARSRIGPRANSPR